MANVLARKTMTAELATFVKMNTLITLIALNVNASLITQLMTLMFVLRRVVNVLVRKTMTTGHAIAVRMNTMVILIAFSVIAALATP